MTDLVLKSSMTETAVCINADSWVARFNDFIATVDLPKEFDGDYPIYIFPMHVPRDGEEEMFKGIYATHTDKGIIKNFDVIYNGDRLPECDVRIRVYGMSKEV